MLQAEPGLAARAPLALSDAEAAVRVAEQPQRDVALAAHRVYLADRRIEIARARSEMRRAEEERIAIAGERERARLDARTREADTARHEANDARSEVARVEAAGASEAAELQRQIVMLQARPTDRGLVLTLGDVLFESGGADLRTGALDNLGKLARFLERYPDRSAVIEGHTDSRGTERFNLALSQRRADAVRTYLVGQGIRPDRLVAEGLGEHSPAAGNDTPDGRERNRRVEVVVSNPAAPVAR